MDATRNSPAQKRVASPREAFLAAPISRRQLTRTRAGEVGGTRQGVNTDAPHIAPVGRPRPELFLSWAPPGSVPKVKITVFEKGKNEPRTLEAPAGSNLRKVLLENKVDVYTLRGKLTNCGGGGQCGTCVVDILEGQVNTNPRGWRETKIFENKKAPETWRLSCCTKIEGPITLRTKPE
ncbi:hypothetical protein CCYA_CCYA14G3805 [Cyanidiococcus yangmingshanensis]|nr:hypothetical protein CCYA_CCYA14G3805 [Cyanidiococcus yangmingshanensis]